MIEERKPDIIVIDNKEQRRIIIDIAVPADVRVREKERQKVEKYHDLKREIGRLWKLKLVEVVPVVIGAVGSVTKGFDRWIEKLGIPICNAKNCVVGNCKDIEESAGNVKKR